MKIKVGLDIGSHTIKIVGIRKTSKGVLLTHLGLKNIPKGIDSEDNKILSQIIKLALEEMGIKNRSLNLSLSGDGIHLRRIVIPSLPKNELMEAIRWEIKTFLPFPLEEATFRYYIIDKFIQDKIKKLDLVVIALPTSLIKRSISIIEEAGLKLEHLDVSPFSIWNTLLQTDGIRIGETIALLDFGSKKVNLYIYKDGIIQFGREFSPGADDLTQAIADEIPSKEDPHLIFELAEKIKEEVGIQLSPEKIKIDEASIEFSKLIFIMRPILERWVSEINRSIEYYRTQFYGEHIDRILIYGGGSNLKNLLPYLNQELRIPVEHFNPLVKIPYDSEKVDSNLVGQQGATFPVAFGASLSGPKKIDFLPEKISLWQKVSLEKFTFLIIPLLTILIFIFLIWQNETKLNRLKKEHEDKMAKIIKLESLFSELGRLKEKENKIKKDLSLFPASVTKPLLFSEILFEISNIIPPNVTLSNLEISTESKNKKYPKLSQQKNSEIKDGEKKILYLSGIIFGNDFQIFSSISKIIEGLENSTRFENVKLLSASENKKYNISSSQFEIVCEVKPLIIRK